MPTLGLGITAVPHLIPAGTIANQDIERAETEPLALGRDEVIYLVCTHPRVKFLDFDPTSGHADVARSSGSDLNSEIQWEKVPWARLTLPAHALPSKAGWTILDPALESVEGIPPRTDFDPSRDPDGEAGRNRQELLAWIWDRHEEADRENDRQRGSVDGGELDFRLEYIGKSNENALRRATGAHHKTPQILGSTLTFRPDRLLYLFPCEIQVATFDVDDEVDSIPMKRLSDAAQELSMSRDLLIATAEEMLIAWLDPHQNTMNTKARRFPSSGTAEQLAARGFSVAGIGLGGLPAKTKITGKAESAERGSPSYGWSLVEL